MQAPLGTEVTSVSAEVSRWLLRGCRAAQVSADAGVGAELASKGVEVSRAALSLVDGAGSEVLAKAVAWAYMVVSPFWNRIV